MQTELSSLRASESAKLLPSDFAIVPIYNAVGTAMILDSAPTGYSDLNMVVRTPNRGGAQCGMHIVPRNTWQILPRRGQLSIRLKCLPIAWKRSAILLDICTDELYGKRTIYDAKS